MEQSRRTRDSATTGHQFRVKKSIRGLSSLYLHIFPYSNFSFYRIQNTLRSQLIANDEFDWSPPYAQSPTAPKLERVAGIDIAVKGDNAIICIAIEQDRDRVLYLKREVVFTEPYRAGFQAFREAPSILAILKEVEVKYPQYYPQVIFILFNCIG